MSISFNNDLSEQQSKWISEAFGSDLAALDRRTALVTLSERYDELATTLSDKVEQPIEITTHGIGETKTMSDGTVYEVTHQGWRKVKP